MAVHIGKKIKEVVGQSRFTVIEFAEKINLTRDVVYKIFAKENINTALLQKISHVLEHDFFHYYSHDLPIVKEPGKVGYTKKTDLIGTMGEEIKILKKRLAELDENLETVKKLNKLQEEKLARLSKKSKK